jgi:hypothetical protein
MAPIFVRDDLGLGFGLEFPEEWGLLWVTWRHRQRLQSGQ